MMRIASLLIASANPHKIREIKRILAGCPMKVVGAREAGIDIDVEEDGATFEVNAVKKALAFASCAGVFALADDSGLEVDALGGRPGVYSARYAGLPEVSYEANNRKLLLEMENVPDERRTARFVCVVAFASPKESIFTSRGQVEGLITRAPRGTAGFGYDPVFLYPPFAQTFGELSEERKNTISHRARALEAFRQKFFQWLENNPS